MRKTSTSPVTDPRDAHLNAIVGANLQAALSEASPDEAWAAIESFETPERARAVINGTAPTVYVYELMGAAQAMHISAADLLEGVRG